jgi:hypothetical protein
LERFRGIQKEDERGTFSVLVLYGIKSSQIINDDILLTVVLNFMECEDVKKISNPDQNTCEGQ